MIVRLATSPRFALKIQPLYHEGVTTIKATKLHIQDNFNNSMINIDLFFNYTYIRTVFILF